MTSKRTNNRISLTESIRLRDWFIENQDSIRLRELTQNDVARWAGKELGIHLTDNNVRRIAGDSDKSLIQFTWPASTRKSLSRNARQGQIRLIVQMIEDLREAIGHEPEGELATLWFAMREDLGIELTPVAL